MNKSKYLIGDVANLIGMSRDTLRHYEKRGLVTVQKADNGYRYYTEAEVAKLLSIFYQRKMDIGLDDIAALWNEQSPEDSTELLRDIIEQRLQEEEEAILQHKRTIARLKLSQNDCTNIQNHIGKVIPESIPSSYIIDPHLDFQDGIAQWFQYTKEHPGMDTMYLFDEYCIHPERNEQPLSLAYQNSQLLLHKDMAEYTDYPITPDIPCTDDNIRYLSAFCTSQDRVPPIDIIQTMLTYAKEQNLSVKMQVFSTFLMQGVRGQKQCYYLQLFLPLCNA